jgi:hypothetical protein
VRYIKMTPWLANRVAMDAGNRSMRFAGRTAWNEDDAEVCRLEYDRLYPVAQELMDNTVEP